MVPSSKKEFVPNAQRITLCGVQGCCPTVDICNTEDRVVIQDDHGGKVTLTKAEWHEATTKAAIK